MGRQLRPADTLGALFVTLALAGAEGAIPFGAALLLAGLAFSLGLILVLVGEESF